MSAIENLSRSLDITGNGTMSMSSKEIAAVFGCSVHEVNRDVDAMLQSAPKAYGQVITTGGEYVLGPIAVMALVLGNRYGGDAARYSIAEYVMSSASGNRLAHA